MRHQRPSLKTRFLGSPLVVLPTFGFFLWSGYQLLTRGGDMWPIVGTATLFTAWVMRAYEQVDAYRCWQRAWNGMDGGAPRQRRLVKPLTGIVALVIAGFYLAATMDRTDTQTAVAISVLWGAGILGFFAVRRLFRWRRGRKASKPDLVRVCVKRVSAAPPLAKAYDALPAYCWAIMGGR